MQVLAWTHAHSFVTDRLSLLLTLPENMHSYIEFNIQERLSLADGIVLVHFLGLTKAVEFIRAVDPWQYPHDKTVGPVCLGFTQSAIDKAVVAGKHFSDWTEESKSNYLLSALLIQKRPELIPKPKKARYCSMRSLCGAF